MDAKERRETGPKLKQNKNEKENIKGLGKS